MDSPFTSEETVTGTTLSKSKKTSCHNSISNKMIKAGLLSSLPFLIILFNKILQTQVYLAEWSRQRVTPIPKFGEMGNLDNHRGITINSFLSKIFKLLPNIMLQHFINEKDILNKNQIDFCKGVRTVDRILIIKTLMKKYLSKNKKLYFCFVDFGRAYDSISREAL